MIILTQHTRVRLIPVWTGLLAGGACLIWIGLLQVILARMLPAILHIRHPIQLLDGLMTALSAALIPG